MFYAFGFENSIASDFHVEPFYFINQFQHFLIIEGILLKEQS